MSRKLILTSNAYFPSIGGIENSLRHLAEEAKEKGWDVKIIVSDIGVSKAGLRIRETVVGGITVIRYPIYPIALPILRNFNFFLSCFLLWRVMRLENKLNPASVVVARFHFNALFAKWAGFRDVRYLVPSVIRQQIGIEIRSEPLLTRVKKAGRLAVHSWVQKKALRAARCFVFSETMRRQCSSLSFSSQAEYAIVKPGVDPNRFFPVSDMERGKLRVSIGLPLNIPVILFVGRFVKAKGVDLLLEALCESRSSVHLLIVGAGEQENLYRSFISKKGLGGSVTIHPATTCVEKFYQAADLFAVPSSYEPLGQTLLEASASGLRIIAFRNCCSVDTATEELNLDEYVSYACHHTASSYAEAIDDAVAKLGSFSRDEMHKDVVQKYSWERLLATVAHQ